MPFIFRCNGPVINDYCGEWGQEKGRGARQVLPLLKGREEKVSAILKEREREGGGGGGQTKDFRPFSLKGHNTQ